MLHPLFEIRTSNVILFKICFAAFCLSGSTWMSPFYYDATAVFGRIDKCSLDKAVEKPLLFISHFRLFALFLYLHPHSSLSSSNGVSHQRAYVSKCNSHFGGKWNEHCHCHCKWNYHECEMYCIFASVTNKTKNLRKIIQLPRDVT